MGAVKTLVLAIGLVLGIAGSAGAQSAQQQAAARTLFEEGKRLLGEGKVEQACGKFEGSLKLSPKLGTRLNVADCYERMGKTRKQVHVFPG